MDYPSSSLGQATQGPARQGEISNHSGRLSDAITQLESSIGVLAERLQPIIRNVPETQAEELNKEESPLTQFAKDFREKRIRIDRLIQVVKFMTSHLEI